MSQASHQGGATGVAATARCRRNNDNCAGDRAAASYDRLARPSSATSECRGSGSGSQDDGHAAAAPTAQPRRRGRRRRCRLLGALTFSYLALSLSRAKADTAQLIRVQKIQSNLLSADATATNAFLVGGLEPPAQRAVYDQALSSTSSLIVEGCPGTTGRRRRLCRPSTSRSSATRPPIEQARANNRQGLPVGAQYLRNASAELRSTHFRSWTTSSAPMRRERRTRWTPAPAILVLVIALLGAGRR